MSLCIRAVGMAMHVLLMVAHVHVIVAVWYNEDGEQNHQGHSSDCKQLYLS